MGNYHNIGLGDHIREECVDIGDVQKMIRWFVEVARRSNEYTRVIRDLKKRLDALFERGRRQLTRTAAAIREPVVTDDAVRGII
jgi:hypothetical protein